MTIMQKIIQTIQIMLKYAKVVKSMCNKQKKSYIIQEPGMLEMLKNK